MSEPATQRLPAGVTPEDFTRTVEVLIALRQECLAVEPLDADGLVLISHAIGWLNARRDGVKYTPRR